MKREYRYVAVTAAALFAVGTANAQSTARAERADGFARALSYKDYLKGADIRASELVGARVRNAAGESLGEIEELVIPSGNQRDMLVVLSVGGVLDVGDKLVALPYADLKVSADGATFYFDRTKEQLETEPAFTYDAAAEVQSRADRRDDRPVPAARGAAESNRQRAPAPSAATAAKVGNVVLDVFDYRASDLIGAAVLDDRGERVGKVDDIVVSTDDDKLHAVIAIGGFAGFGAKRISLPLDDLQLTSNDDTPQVRIAMTGEQLLELVDVRPEFRYERQIAEAPANNPRG